jgi:hypothetical protein
MPKRIFVCRNVCMLVHDVVYKFVVMSVSLPNADARWQHRGAAIVRFYLHTTSRTNLHAFRHTKTRFGIHTNMCFGFQSYILIQKHLNKLFTHLFLRIKPPIGRLGDEVGRGDI